VNGTLPPFGTNRYALRALAGQALVVDIAAPLPLVLSVLGENGTVLVLERMDEKTRWEGRLPSTQDYLLELVSTGAAIGYHLTVTIPGLTESTPAAMSTYRNAEYGFEVKYPSDFGVGLTCPTAGVIHDPVISFRLVGDPYYAGTNLLDACVTISVDRGEAARSTCLGPRDSHEKYLGQEQINGILFSKVFLGGVAAGHIHDAIIYRTLHAGACYELASFLRYSDPGAYAPGTVSEFDREGVINGLRQVLTTFRFADDETPLSAERKSPFSSVTEIEGMVYYQAVVNPNYQNSPPFSVRYAASDWELVPGDSSGRFDQLRHRGIGGCTLWLQVGPSQASRVTTVELGGYEWAVFSQARPGYLIYSTPWEDQAFILMVTLPDPGPEQAKSPCQQAAEEVLMTFQVLNS
jgi:hypothetical protein